MTWLGRTYTRLRRWRTAGSYGMAEPIGTRATILAEVDELEEAAAAEAWLEAARGRLTYVSNQLGCGCCILMWDVEGPAELIATLPIAMRCDSEWTRNPMAPRRLH